MAKSITAGKVPKINAAIAARVLEVVDAGLCSGMGRATPGEMCVEAAVCYAMGEPHSDNPKCVLASVRSLKIGMNDNPIWEYAEDPNKLRAAALRRVAIAQLGTKGKVSKERWQKAYVAAFWDKSRSKKDYARALKEYTKDQIAFKAHLKKHLAEINAGARQATKCGGIVESRFNYFFDKKPVLAVAQTEFVNSELFDEIGVKSIARAKAVCEEVVQLLKKVGAPGTKFLYLTEPQKKKPAKAKRNTKRLVRHK